jgi:hypothetical protein
MLRFPKTHRLPQFARQRVRSAEVVVELMNGRPIAVVRCVFSMMTVGMLLSLLSNMGIPYATLWGGRSEHIRRYVDLTDNTRNVVWPASPKK